MAETPCQKCKRERDELAAKLSGAALKLATAYTDLNKAEADRDALAAHVRGLERAPEGRSTAPLVRFMRQAELAERRARDLERALGNAIERLNEFLQAFEGAPDPSENDTKRLVARLESVLHNDG